MLIVLWIGFLGFIAWEFIFANKMPEKYSKLKPAKIRLIDVAIAALVILTIWQLASD